MSLTVCLVANEKSKNGLFLSTWKLFNFSGFHVHVRLGKSACPRVLDDQKEAVDDQIMIPGRPHDDKNVFFDSLTA